MKKFLFTFGVLALAAANAGSYRLRLFERSLVNGVELKPGEYRVEVNGSKATIKRGKQSVEAAVRLENAGDKFRSTSVRYENGDGKYTIREIRLRGTSTRLIFDAATEQAQTP